MLLSGAGAGTEAGAGSKLDWLHNTDRSTWYCTVTYIGTCTQTPSVTDSYNFTRIQNLKKNLLRIRKRKPIFFQKEEKIPYVCNVYTGTGITELSLLN